MLKEQLLLARVHVRLCMYVLYTLGKCTRNSVTLDMFYILIWLVIKFVPIKKITELCMSD